MLASGVTAIAGFAALAATDIRMLRDFGLVTVADLAVALAGVLLVLPAALVWAEEGFKMPGDPRGGLGATGRPRGRPASPASPGSRGSGAPTARSGREPPEARVALSRSSAPSAAIYSVVVGLIFVAVIAVAGISALRAGDDREVLGSESEALAAPGQFAVPDARSDLEGDANIAQDDCESARIPCPEDEVRTPACEVDLEGAIRVCDLFDKPLVLSFWFTRGGECEAQQDEFEAVYREYGDRVNFLGDQRRATTAARCRA